MKQEINSIKNPADYLPHRPPFLLIDELEVTDPDHFCSKVNPATKPYLTRNGIPEETFLIENIAQTCAAAFGYFAKKDNGEPQMGYIGAVSKLEMLRVPDSSAIMTTSVKVLQRFGAITLVEGSCFTISGELLMKCEMKIVLAPSEE